MHKRTLYITLCMKGMHAYESSCNNMYLVIVVGAGPSGLATSACLTQNLIPHLILERDDCYASLWKKRTYDRLNLHLPKHLCQLPYISHSLKSPTYLSKNEFIDYLDGYVFKFEINPLFHRSVESAAYDEVDGKWRVEAINIVSKEVEVYFARFLVVATGENNVGYIPSSIPGLDGFRGEIIHSNMYKSGLAYRDKRVLVVGSGNSGMEIAYDLSNFGVHACIVIRNPLHVLTKGMIRLGMMLLMNKLPVWWVDLIIIMLATYTYGNLAPYGMPRPKAGPFFSKVTTGRSPVIDVGTVKRIKDGKIKVLPEICKISEKKVVFVNGIEKEYDAIVFATGYKTLTNTWLKDYKFGLNENGMPKNSYPNHWKGDNGLYVAGLSRRGLEGVKHDAIAISNDIKQLHQNEV